MKLFLSVSVCVFVGSCGTIDSPDTSSQTLSIINSHQSEVELFLCERTKNSMDAYMVVSGVDYLEGDISKDIRTILETPGLKECWPFAYVALGVYGNAQDIPYLVSKSEDNLGYLSHGEFRETLKGEKNYILHKNRHYALRSAAWLTRFTDESDSEFSLIFDLLKDCSEPSWWSSSSRSWKSELPDEMESTACLDFIAMMESDKAEEFLLSINPRSNQHKEQIDARIIANQYVRSKGIMGSILPGLTLRER